MVAELRNGFIFTYGEIIQQLRLHGDLLGRRVLLRTLDGRLHLFQRFGGLEHGHLFLQNSTL